MSNYFINSALQTLETEIKQINNLRSTLESEAFTEACSLLANCTGKVVCMGIGKSGHIARKLSASLASTGTSSFYVHPCEAGHGDAGMITKGDLVIYISNSGESLEFNSLISYLQKEEIAVIAITNNAHSTLASKAQVTLLLNVETEACPLKLAPTSSTTNTLVLGDCLTVALIDHKKLTVDQFALSHPFGALGRRLLLKNKNIMKVGEELALLPPTLKVSEALITFSTKNLGCVLVVAEPKTFQQDQPCLGIFTDGDLRRLITNKEDFYNLTLQEVMTKKFTAVDSEALAFDSLKIMEEKRITVLPVIDSKANLLGLVHFHDLVKAGM